MRRALVLTDESARHPFRATLPPHVCARSVDDVEHRVPWRTMLGLSAADVRMAAMTYLAAFIGTSAFIF